MSLASRFLNLSMKEQICITIIALTLFCIGVILIVCCSLIYEILDKDYEQKKLYFYKRYKEYIESVFYFQSFYLMQYEEIIHRMQKQTWRMEQSISIYKNFQPIQDYGNYIINMTEESQYNFTELISKKQKDTPYFYIISYSSNSSYQEYVKDFSLVNYQTFANSIITHDIYEYFKIPGYGVPIIDDPLFYNLRFSTMFTFDYNKSINKIKQYEYIETITPQESIENIFNGLLYNNVQKFLNRTIYYMLYINNKLEIFPHMYEKFFREITSYSPGIFTNKEEIYNNSKMYAGYMSGIEYGNDTISILSTDINENYFTSELNTIKDLLFFLNNNLTYSLDIDFIPLHWETNKVISPELCSLFKAKQKFLSGQDFDYSEIFNDIHKWQSDISNCFIDSKLLEDQEEIKVVFEQNFERFTEYTNIIYQGLLDIVPDTDNYPFYFMKYSFPNYNSLKEFQSEYLFFDQVNFYSFASFKIAQKYVDHVYQVTQNIFFFIVMVIIYSWLVCLFINLMIFFKVIKEWTEPITKLQEAVESSNIKDESIFTYKYDDIINELFVTCKELLTGQIDNNNENGLKNFNILGKEKDQKIDKNIYKKNLIINNEIMDDLINKQQSMLDFSNNIKVNEPNNISGITHQKTSKSIRKSNQSKDNLNSHKDSNKKEKEKKELENKKKTEQKKENEPYIKLFKIAEYLNYYRSKLETNNVIFVNNNDYDETKMSKMISKNTKSINSSISNQLKNRNDESNENNYINMLDETNITYLWYMETKKRYKNFNYNVSSDCRELFTEFNDSYKTIQRIDPKKSINLHKKDKNTGM